MRTAALLVLVAPAIARAQAPIEFAVDSRASTITYRVVHKMHKVDGTSHQLEGKVRLLPDGKVQAMLRVPAASFDSGNVNRDAHMKEAVDAARYPTVELKAMGEGVSPASSYPATVDKTLKAQLSFHGIQQLIDVPVKLTFESATRVRAKTGFQVSLDAFKVERPSLMFIKVDDALEIAAEVLFTR
jgi:hypothetical protein